MAATTVTWTTFAKPRSLTAIADLAVCTQCDNILCFTDLKTLTVNYYKCETIQFGFSVKAIDGHNRFGFLAFAELMLRSSIHIIQYPQLTKFATFSSPNILSFVDIKFNDHDLLVALSDAPNYTICIWNFRTGQQIVEQDTMQQSLRHSLALSWEYTPQILQYSDHNKEVLIWEMCHLSGATELHQIFRLQLPKEYCLTHLNFILCYGEDNNIYYVDNKGIVSLIDIANYYPKYRWSVPDEDINANELQYYSIFPHKQGLLVLSSAMCYYIRRKQIWQMDWKVNLLGETIYRLVSNMHGEIYAAGHLGNLYRLEESSENNYVLNPLEHFHWETVDFVVLRGTKEEAIVQVGKRGDLRLIDLQKQRILSVFSLPGAKYISSHNTAPYIVISTKHSTLEFINYSNINSPILVHSLPSESGHRWEGVRWLENFAVIHDEFYEFYLFEIDFGNNKFDQLYKIEKLLAENRLYDYFLSEDNYIFMFIQSDIDGDQKESSCNELWIYEWGQHSVRIERNNYNLPHQYRGATKLAIYLRNAVQFAASRYKTVIIDILNFQTELKELSIVYSFATTHLASITGLSGARNIISWSLDATYLHLRVHPKAKKMYSCSHCVQTKVAEQPVVKTSECFTFKYLVFLYVHGGMKAMKIDASPTLHVYDNIFYPNPEQIIERSSTKYIYIQPTVHDVVITHTKEEIAERDSLIKRINELAKSVTTLIDYDMSVTGKKTGLFRKFCLNNWWLKDLTAEAEKLCEVERKSYMDAIRDQSRIRDWIYNLIMTSTTAISYRTRALFSGFSVENYGLRKQTQQNSYDLYRFHGMEPFEDEDGDKDGDELNTYERLEAPIKRRKYFTVQGSSVYDHVLSPDLALQDTDVKFDNVRKLKSDLIDSILQTNAVLTRNYANQNIMLRLLHMETFVPAELSVPVWEKDEIVKRIMEVDDSEIKAINRRAKKAEVVAKKRGRMLLWSVEFWVRALIVMMDGVLEKLWEEEIKKDIPMPEFMFKKQLAEYTLEDQKILRDYEEKVRLLNEDRKKYLRILGENEVKSKELKNTYIMKLNETITDMMITKLKYDFAIKEARLRNLNTKVIYNARLKCMKFLNKYRLDLEDIAYYIEKYERYAELWDSSITFLRGKQDNVIVKERTVERQFKNQFLNAVSPQLTTEMNRAYKKRPKLPPKLMNSVLICKQLSLYINAKPQIRSNFPIAKDVLEYLDALKAMDNYAAAPPNVEMKQWEQFTKLRRQKVEAEFRLRAINLQIADAQGVSTNFTKSVYNLRNKKSAVLFKVQDYQEHYLAAVQNQTLELRLTMGQVETSVLGHVTHLQNCILMHEDDINDINQSILKAGQMKLKAMQRVAYFRRQVIFKEWEHKVTSANIDYLKYMLGVIEKCKVSQEFLAILRRWEKVKAEKEHFQNTVGLIEKVCEDRTKAVQLKTLLELQRLRTFPTLGPNLPGCP
uniref:Cilia- and flagella-associated protein 43 n=1 Tax=Glossina palpalis gambiensis TaxID=67801 RepID=A0A1B0C1E3_9MUSC